MSGLYEREIVATEDCLRSLVDDIFIPAADSIAGGNFLATNEITVREQRTVTSYEDSVERMLFKFEASCFPSEDASEHIYFTIAKIALLDPLYSQLTDTAIQPALVSDEEEMEPEIDDEWEDDEVDIMDFFENETPTQMDYALRGERIVEHTVWKINTKTLVPYRKFDALRFFDGEFMGSFQDNEVYFDILYKEDPNLDVDKDIAGMIELSDYWDGDDIAAIRFAVRAMGLRVPRRTK